MRRVVWIVRHGDRRDFAEPAWRLRAARPDDPPLAATGIGQARALGEGLHGAGIAHLFCSPFLRAVQTAHHIAMALDLPVNIEPGLSEWLSLAWFPKPPQLLTTDELAQRFPSIDHAYRARGFADYGESGDEALARSGRTAQALVRDFYGDLLLVSHGVSLLGATAGLLGVGADAIRSTLGSMPYACVVKLVKHADTAWVIDAVTDAAHSGPQF
jgi:broad specificity phosphatase PhoE